MATLQDDPAGSNGVTYTATPLLTQTVKLLKTSPEIIKVNLFELKSADFQQFALWLDIVERAGRETYRRLEESAQKLLPLKDESAPESLDRDRNDCDAANDV